MTDDMHPPTDASLPRESSRWRTRLLARLVPTVVLLTLLIGTAAAQSPGQSFCNTDMAQTIQNIFTLIQFGGPLLGGVLALGATVVLPFVRRSDWKKEMKEIRNQGLLWGVIVAPLGTQIIAFILNNVVAGGSSCGF
jgi:hypothetical protein